MEQNAAHNDPLSQNDIFDMEAHHKTQRDQGQVPPVESHASPGDKSNVTLALLNRLLKLSPRHLAMITAGIICIGLAWSRLTAHTPAPPSGNDQLLPTDFQQPATPPAAERTLPAAPPRPEQNNVLQDPTPPSPAPLGESERAIIRTALEDLNARVTQLETGAVQANASAAPVVPVTAPVAIEPQRLASTPVTRKHHHVARAEALPVLAGYSLNTIYQNQAWIEHDGATYAVQVGDKIGSLPITSIDARARRVVTPNGQIR